MSVVVVQCTVRCRDGHKSRVKHCMGEEVTAVGRADLKVACYKVVSSLQPCNIQV